MAKDYKNSPKPKDKPKNKKNGGFPGWGWFLLGIVACFAIIKGGPLLWQAESTLDRRKIRSFDTTAPNKKTSRDSFLGI